MAPIREFAIELYRTADGKVPFLEWLAGVRDPHERARIDIRLARVRAGNLGDHRELQDGIVELRLFHGPGYRVYCAREGSTAIVLLLGGIKKTQSKDIRTARALYAEYKSRNTEAHGQLPRRPD